MKWLRVEDLKRVLEERENNGEKPILVFRCTSCEKKGKQFIFLSQNDVWYHLESEHDMEESAIDRIVKSAFNVPFAQAGLSESTDYFIYGKRQSTNP